MASRKEQKEQARARRLAEEQARAERERRDRRLRLVGGTIVAAVAVVAVAIAISTGSGGGGATGLQKGPKLATTEAQVSSLLAGIPQSGSQLGSSSAKVTLTYYGDLECPVCRAFTLGDSGGGWPKLVATEVRSGKVKVVYRSLQTASRDASTFQAQQVAALAAGKSNRFWNYVELFYHEQGPEGTGYVTSAYLSGLAQQAGLNLSAWNAARNDPTLAAQVNSDTAAAQAANASATPTLIAKGPKGTVPVQAASGIPTYSELLQAVNAAA